MIAVFLYQNPRTLILTIIVIVAAGLSSFFVMPRMEDPVLGRRVALVSTAFPGANPRRVESLVTIPLEENLSIIANIKQVRSNSQNGISNLVIELEDDVQDVDAVWALVRDALADSDAYLPETCQQSDLYVVPLKAYAAIIAVRNRDVDKSGLAQLRAPVRQLRSQLAGIWGTEKVDVFGDPGEEVIVEFTPQQLTKTGLSIVEVAEQIRGAEIRRPAGRILQGDRELSVSLEREGKPSKRTADTVITYGQRDQTAPLSDLANVEQRLVEPSDNLAVIGGEESIVLGVMINDELRVDVWAGQLESTLSEFRDEQTDIEVDVLFSQSDYINDRMDKLLDNLGIGTCALVVVVFVLMGWRSMVIVAAALPLSALLVISGMRAMSIPIHQMSITGLIIALGLLIDNAIVIVEDVRSRIIAGAKTSDAVIAGVHHLAIPLFGSTLTTALAFLPIATLPGPPGEFVGTIAVSVILAIISSFVLAMTVIPSLIGLLRVQPGHQGLFSYGLTIPQLRKIYELSLRFVFRWPVLGVLLGLVLPIAGFLASANLPEQFFPASDRTQIQIEVELPASDAIESTRKTVDRVREIVSENSSVEQQYWFLGKSAPTFFYNVVPRRQGTPFYAQAFIDIERGANSATLVEKLQATLDEEVPNARIIVRQLEQGPPFDAPVEVRLIGPEVSELQRLGSELRLLLGETNHVLHTRSDLEDSIPQLTFIPDDEALRTAGLDHSQLAGLLYTTLEGAAAGTVFVAEEELPIRVKLALDGNNKTERLLAMPLPGSGQHQQPTELLPGKVDTESKPSLNAITFGSLVTSQLDADVGAIVRIDGQRANEVKAYIQAGVLPSIVLDEFKHRLDESDFQLPVGYSLQFGGENEQRSQAVANLIANGTVLFALMLLTLVASFRSFRCAFIIATVGGLSIGLGPLALSVFGYPFGFMAIVGTMGLVGVAINDSIVVLAAIRANPEISEGHRGAMASIVCGCTRHIIATTLTTIIGFLPLILDGGRFWPPLAITIAGGVAGATFLALYFVPCLYLLVYGIFLKVDPGAAETPVSS